MRFVFRVDASIEMGVGHFMRCLTLAEELRNRGGDVQFICREHPGNLILLLREKNFSVTKLPAAYFYSTNKEDYAAWLGVTQEEDAKESISALSGEMPDWMIVDHYGLDAEWEQSMRPHTRKLMVIDDLANRWHECDVLLDQNYSHKAETRYRDLVPQHCTLLSGPRYALLRPEYVSNRKTLPVRNGKARKVLIFLGGSDPYDITSLALEALSRPDLAHLNVDVVIGTNNSYAERIREWAKKRSGVSVHGPRPHLADLMVKADLAIGAGGATTWERMCLGLPTIVISIAENQIPATLALADDGLIEYIGKNSDVDSQKIAVALLDLIESPERLADMSIKNGNRVDGLGTLRVAEALMPNKRERAFLRDAQPDDAALYFDWVNDPVVRQSAINTDLILWEDHKIWFEKKLRATNSHLFIMEVAGLPIGQIRFDCDEEGFIFDYSLDVVVRGRGWGSKLIELGVAAIWQKDQRRARTPVKYDNQASRAALLKMGFIETLGSSDKEAVFYLDPPHK